MLDIAVCVCTYHRPTTLRHLLETLAEQTLRPREVIVVDNDHAGSARDVCERFDAPFTIRYAIESVQNISRARNHALSLASCPWLAFIDDDEWAPPQWLERMAGAAERYAADGVLGPVIAPLPDTAPAWLRRGGFYDRNRHATGTPVPRNELRTSNLLLHRPPVDAAGIHFDPVFGKTGGEDSDFLSRLAGTGMSFVWCDEAEVVEPVPASRQNLRWLRMRAFRGGQNYAQNKLNGRFGEVGAAHKLAFLIRSVIALCVCFVAAALLLPFSRTRSAQWLCKGYAQAGKLAAFSAYRYEEYAPGSGS